MTWRNIYVGVIFAELSSLNMNGFETVDEGFVDSQPLDNEMDDEEEEEESDGDADSAASELPDLEDFESIPDDEGLGHMLDEWEDILSGWMENLHVKVKSIAQTPTHFFVDNVAGETHLHYGETDVLPATSNCRPPGWVQDRTDGHPTCTIQKN